MVPKSREKYPVDIVNKKHIKNNKIIVIIYIETAKNTNNIHQMDEQNLTYKSEEETTHDKNKSKRIHDTEIEETMQIQRQSEELEESRKSNCIKLQLTTSQNTNSEDEKMLLLAI